MASKKAIGSIFGDVVLVENGWTHTLTHTKKRSRRLRMMMICDDIDQSTMKSKNLIVICLHNEFE